MFGARRWLPCPLPGISCPSPKTPWNTIKRLDGMHLRWRRGSCCKESSKTTGGGGSDGQAMAGWICEMHQACEQRRPHQRCNLISRSVESKGKPKERQGEKGPQRVVSVETLRFFAPSCLSFTALPFPLSLSLFAAHSHDRRDHRPRMLQMPKLGQINALPRAQGEFTCRDRDRDRGTDQGGFGVGDRVVGALVSASEAPASEPSTRSAEK